MSTDVIGLRYQLATVVAGAGESTTWRAHDTWLDQPVLLVTPEPTTAARARFEDVAASVRAHASPHLVELYDAGPSPSDFVVLLPPAATLADRWSPGNEEDVLAMGRSLGDAVAALHERGIIHGGLHPGMVVSGDGGELTLSPWPLTPEPAGWSGPGGFAGDLEEQQPASAASDVRAVGALLLGALSGASLLSSEQVGNDRDELALHAPVAAGIADRALTPAERGGYRSATELRDDCAAALGGEAPTPEPAIGDPTRAAPLFRPGRPRRPIARTGATNAAGTADADAASPAVDPPEGRRMAVAVAVAAALVAGASATGALSGPPPSHYSAAKACEAHRSCRTPSTVPSPTAAAAGTPTQDPPPRGGAITTPSARRAPSATFADLPVSSSTTRTSPGASAPRVASVSSTPAVPPVTSSGTSPPSAVPPSTSTTSSSTTTTTTTASTATTTTAPTTTTTTQPAPTTSTTSGSPGSTSTPGGPGTAGSPGGG